MSSLAMWAMALMLVCVTYASQGQPSYDLEFQPTLVLRQASQNLGWDQAHGVVTFGDVLYSLRVLAGILFALQPSAALNLNTRIIGNPFQTVSSSSWRTSARYGNTRMLKTGSDLKEHKVTPGDWICQDCGVLVTSERTSCHLCGTPLTDNAAISSVTFDGATEGDWICPRCGDLVWKVNQECKVCGMEPGFAPAISGVRRGDWKCHACAAFCNRMSSICESCGAKQNGIQNRFGWRPGDWVCPACDAFLEADDICCPLCGELRPPGNYWIYKEPAENDEPKFEDDTDEGEEEFLQYLW